MARYNLHLMRKKNENLSALMSKQIPHIMEECLIVQPNLIYR